MKRKLGAIFIILLGLYTLIGFLVVPVLIRHFGEAALKEKINESSKIEKVRFNPFALKLQVEGFATSDPEGAWAVAWDSVEVNLSGLTAVKWFPVFQRIAVDGVEIDVTQLAGVEKAPDVVESDAAEGGDWRDAIEGLNLMELPKLRIDLLEVSDGRANIVDETRAERYEQTIKPINFSLSNLTTVSEDSTTMHLAAETELGTRLSWEGGLTSQPLGSAGTFSLAGVRIDHLSPYYAEFIEFDVEHAVFGLEFDYVVNGSDVENLLVVDNGRIVLSDLVCEPRDEGAQILSIDELSVEGIQFGFPQMELSVERVGISDGNTLVRRNAEGAINLLSLLAEREAGDEPAVDDSQVVPTESSLPPLSYQVDLVELTNYTIQWEEDLSKDMASLAVVVPSFTLEGISSDLENPFTIQAESLIANQGKLSLGGTIVPATGALDLQLNLDDLDLGAVTQYSQEFGGLQLDSGVLSGAGRLTNDADSGIRFVGDIGLIDFSAKQATSSYAWKELAVDQLALTPSPFALSIDSVVLQEPSVSIRRLVSEELEVAEEVATETAEVPAAESEPSNVLIHSIQIASGRVLLVDETVEPNAEIEISELTTELKNLNLAESEIATLELSALFNEASLELSGELAPNAPKQATSLQIKLSSLSLPQFSAYTGQAVGRRVDKGNFNLESDWSIVNNQLTAKNKIVIDQLSFGESVESETAVRLPLDLAVTLLAGPSGVMDLSLPLSGDLSDPKVGIGQIVRTALVGIVTGAVSAPFKLLSGLVDSEADLSVVEFAAGASELSSDMVDRLNAMATALKERPALNLSIVPELTAGDTDALKLAQLRDEILESEAQGDLAIYAQRLRERYKELAKASGIAEAVIAEKIQQSPEILEGVLTGALALPKGLLDTLASERAKRIKQHLTTSHGLDEERLKVTEPDEVEEGTGLRFDLK
ncbi:MAG: DUF748 domain-containing protein [Opitutaceae bacterium]